jgi:chromosome segregation ATPase
MFDDKEARQDIEELQQQLDDTNRQIEQLNDQIQQMQQDLNEMQQSILTVKKEEEQLAQHLRDNFDNRERSLRASMRAIRDRQSQLENKVENEYQQQLEREQWNRRQ